MIDTHSHIYSEEFDTDINDVVKRAKNDGIHAIVLPNVDSESLPRMLKLEAEYPDFCFAAIGLHPTSVNVAFKTELSIIETELKRRKYIAIGEIGLDLYWDKTFLSEQIFCFQQQLQWAVDYNLPVIIHIRDAFRETMDALEPFRRSGLKGVFHSFTGSVDEAKAMLEFGGFKLGINGIVTFKNSGLAEVLRSLSIQDLLLETDAPYLTPVPFRGKRNESSYLKYVVTKLAEIYKLSEYEIKEITTNSANSIFKLHL